MPELPEVETVRSGLQRLLPGHIILSAEALNPKSFPNDPVAVEQFLIGSKVEAVKRRAKVLMIELSSNWSLVIHLKMTGQLVFRGEQHFGAGHPSGSLVAALPDRSTRAILTFTDGSKLFFNDQRKFGWVRLMPTPEVMKLAFFLKVGPEPLDQKFTPTVFKERLKRRPNSSIKAALLDQTVIAGIGNIYADESLWGAKIHPSSLVKQLSPIRQVALYRSIISILLLSIEKGGSTDRNYIDAEGKKGSYLQFASVFRRTGLPCPRCGTDIIKLRVAGRGTHICPHCQRFKTS